MDMADTRAARSPTNVPGQGLPDGMTSDWALLAPKWQLAALYLARGVAGILSAAVLPAVFSYIVEVTVPGRRQKRFAWVASATALRFLLGPAVGNVLGAMAGGGIFGRTAVGMAGSPLVVVAAICFVIASCIALLPRYQKLADDNAAFGGATDDVRIWQSLALTAVMVLGITTAEVGLTLISRDTPVASPRCTARNSQRPATGERSRCKCGCTPRSSAGWVSRAWSPRR